MRVPAILAAAGMAVLGAYYFQNKRTHKTAALICKALATALPGVLMLYWYFCVEGKMTGNGTGSMIGNAAGNEVSVIQAAFVWTLAAILCYMAADVLLECKFVVGVACFSAGHLCMIVSFLSEDGLGLIRETERGLRPDYWIVQLFVLSTVVFILCAYEALKKYFPYLKAKGLFIPAAAYITVLSIMASLGAVSEIRQPGGVAAVIPALGGGCFVISDVLLGINRLGKKRSLVRGAFVLILYYAAVYLFAMRFWGTAIL